MNQPAPPDALFAAGDALTPRREQMLLLTLAAAMFTHTVDFMVMMPLGPQFTHLFGVRDAEFGVLVSAYTLAAGVAGLLASGFVDRFERKRLLLTSYVVFALATLCCSLAETYGQLLVWSDHSLRTLRMVRHRADVVVAMVSWPFK